MGSPVPFLGAADVPHCGPMVRTVTQTSVNVNGIPISRQGDPNTPHLMPGTPCPIHTAKIIFGSSSVFVGGKGCGRVLDVLGTLAIGDSPAVVTCTAVAQGSPSVFAG